MKRAGEFVGAIVVLAIAGILVLGTGRVVAWSVAAGFMLYLIPGLLVMMMISALAGACVPFVCVYQILTDDSTKLITPRDVVAGESGLPALAPHAPARRDWAWPTYLAGQWRVDLRSAVERVNSTVSETWLKLFDYGMDSQTGWVWLPLVVIALPAMIAFSAGTVMGGALIVVIAGAVLVGALISWVGVAGSLRMLDTGLRKLRRASASCPSCHHVTAVPSFCCPGCGAQHWDLQPGRLGGAWRRCGCGQVLPTTVLRASGRLSAHCQRCEARLPDQAAVTTDIRMPVFGPVSAGKTRLVYAGLLAMRERITASGGHIAPEGHHSQQVFDDAVQIIRSGADTVKTPVGERPHAITARVVRDRDTALLQLFDAAGEFYVDRELSAEHEFIDHAQALIFVIDPFSIPWVRDQVEATSGGLLALAKPATVDPEQVYQATVGRLLQYELDMKRRLLALAVVKADLLVNLPFAQALLHGDPRGWLMDAGLDNLVLGAERDFAKVCCFVAASVAGPAADGPLSPANPFMWSMEQVGLRPAALRPTLQARLPVSPADPGAAERTTTFSEPPGYRYYRIAQLAVVGAGVLVLCSLGVLAGDEVLSLAMAPVHGVRETWTSWGWSPWWW